MSEELLCVLLSLLADTPDGAPDGVVWAGLMGRVDHATYTATKEY